MKRFIVLLALIVAVPALALCPNDCELYWGAVTTWTDNTAIEPQHLPISYIAEWDNVALPATAQLTVPLPKPYGHGTAHVARVKARTATGIESVYSPPFPWTSPQGSLTSPGGGGIR